MNKGDGVFSQSRSAKVFAAALLSIAVGAVILKSLGKNPPPAGAFSLSEYYHLEPIDETILHSGSKTYKNWNRIEISYSKYKRVENPNQPAQSASIGENIQNFHFIVYNGLIGIDGQIEPTEKWKQQLSALPRRTAYGNEQIIRIGVLVDSNVAYPTNLQMKKTESLTETLARNYEIQPAFIYYPDNWR